MSFEEFIIKSSLKEGSAKKYKNLLDNVCADMNIKLKTISLNNIDGIINNVKNDISYVRKAHGNSYVAALRKYKGYLLCINNKTELSDIPDKPKLPQTGMDENGYFIRYADDVEDMEKVPGLCYYLEGEYEMILVFARKLFGDRVCDYNRIPVVLSKELPTEQYRLSSEEKAKMIDFKYRNGHKPSIKESEKIIDKDSITFPVLGRYFGLKADGNNDPYIVLYYKNFGTCDLELYKAKIDQTLAHEYMHYTHNLIAKDTFNGKGKHTEAVKEAVADFFGVLYSVWSHKNDKKIEAALDRFNTWVDYFGSNWPYSNALWFLLDGDDLFAFSDQFDYYVNNDATRKFIKVVFESKNDKKTAYSVLTF